MYGKFGSIRYICSSFSIEIKQRRVFKLILARWRSQPIRWRLREREPITSQIQSISLKSRQSDLFECSLFVGKCVNLFSSIYCLDSLFRMSEADPGLCPIRAIFSKTVFPSRLDPSAQTYPFFKDYDKCFKTQARFRTDIGMDHLWLQKNCK